MGMFDWFYCDRLMPDKFQMRIPKSEIPNSVDGWASNGLSNGLYQTKDMGCHLDVYVVAANGRLLVHRNGEEKNTDLVITDYTGQINIYTDIEPKKVNRFITSMPPHQAQWVEYFLTFEHGVLKSIRSAHSDEEVLQPLHLDA